MTLSPAQRAFLRLHVDHVHTWQWKFAGTQLRATSDNGSATIWSTDLEHLIVLGLMARAWGFSVRLTSDGVAAAMEWEMAA